MVGGLLIALAMLDLLAVKRNEIFPMLWLLHQICKILIILLLHSGARFTDGQNPYFGINSAPKPVIIRIYFPLLPARVRLVGGVPYDHSR